MSSNELRREVLKSFKNLHRTACYVFQNNAEALASVKKEINAEYKKNKNLTNIDSIKDFIRYSNDVIVELKTTVAELEQTPSGNFRLKLRPEMFEEHNHVPLKKLPK